mmetsp:Transcript_193/g.558  ORF Transcript_193/g.558 Transcript_193/m.558 type:complete len:1028 (-) Transcript_193:1901-4984(-)
MGLFRPNRREAGGSPLGPSSPPPQTQGLASLVAMLHSKQGLGGTSSGALGGNLRSAGLSEFASSNRRDASGLGAFAATVGSSGSERGVSTLGGLAGWMHGSPGRAISGGSSTYQPQSPQLREGPSPARRARARARLSAFPLNGSAATGSTCPTPSLASCDDVGGAGADGHVAAWVTHAATESPEQEIARLKNALAAAENSARIAAWDRDAAERRAKAVEAATGITAVEAVRSPGSGPSAQSDEISLDQTHQIDCDQIPTAAGVVGSGCSYHTAQGGASSVSDCAATAGLESFSMSTPAEAASSAAVKQDSGPSGDATVAPQATSREAEAAVAELQTELLAAAAARDSAERRAELAERQQAESHRLLVSLQDRLMQSAIAGSTAGTPLSSPRSRGGLPGSPGSGGFHFAARSLSPSRATTAPRSVNSRGPSALARGVAAEAAASAREAAHEIASLRAQLQATRLERDAACAVAQRATHGDVPRGLGELWEKLLAAEAAALAARQQQHQSSSGGASSQREGGDTPKQVVGEIWQQLRASYAEREVLKRTASQAEAQITHLQLRTASITPCSADLSKAFEAAADAMEEEEDTVPAEARSAPTAKRLRRSISGGSLSKAQAAWAPVDDSAHERSCESSVASPFSGAQQRHLQQMPLADPTTTGTPFSAGTHHSISNAGHPEDAVCEIQPAPLPNGVELLCQVLTGDVGLPTCLQGLSDRVRALPWPALLALVHRLTSAGVLPRDHSNRPATTDSVITLRPVLVTELSFSPQAACLSPAGEPALGLPSHLLSSDSGDYGRLGSLDLGSLAGSSDGDCISSEDGGDDVLDDATSSCSSGLGCSSPTRPGPGVGVGETVVRVPSAVKQAAARIEAAAAKAAEELQSPVRSLPRTPSSIRRRSEALTTPFTVRPPSDETPVSGDAPHANAAEAAVIPRLNVSAVAAAVGEGSPCHPAAGHSVADAVAAIEARGEQRSLWSPSSWGLSPQLPAIFRPETPMQQATAAGALVVVASSAMAWWLAGPRRRRFLPFLGL